MFCLNKYIIKQMQSVRKMSNESGNLHIHVVQRDDGHYSLQKYVTQYDSEEEVHYTIRGEPDPGGIYMCLSDALAEGERLLKIGC